MAVDNATWADVVSPIIWGTNTVESEIRLIIAACLILSCADWLTPNIMLSTRGNCAATSVDAAAADVTVGFSMRPSLGMMSFETCGLIWLSM